MPSSLHDIPTLDCKIMSEHILCLVILWVIPYKLSISYGRSLGKASFNS